MAKSTQQSGQVVIRVDQRLFYGLIVVLGFILTLSIVFYIGLQLGKQSQPQQAVAPIFPQQSTFQQQPNIQVQPGGSPIQVQPAQQNPFSGPAVRRSRLPAGDEVPIGDNPRLALPELAQTNYVYDFGDVPPDQVAETHVTVQNKGTQPLVIKSVRASCGCTVANTGEDTIPPGESTDLRITYDPTYNNDAGKQITRQVLIESNDPAAPTIEFTIKANVLNE